MSTTSKPLPHKGIRDPDQENGRNGRIAGQQFRSGNGDRRRADDGTALAAGTSSAPNADPLLRRPLMLDERAQVGGESRGITVLRVSDLLGSLIVSKRDLLEEWL